MIVKETVVEGPLVEGTLFDRSTNGKWYEDWQPKTQLIKKVN